MYVLCRSDAYTVFWVKTCPSHIFRELISLGTAQLSLYFSFDTTKNCDCPMQSSPTKNNARFLRNSTAIIPNAVSVSSQHYNDNVFSKLIGICKSSSTIKNNTLCWHKNIWKCLQVRWCWFQNYCTFLIRFTSWCWDLKCAITVVHIGWSDHQCSGLQYEIAGVQIWCVWWLVFRFGVFERGCTELECDHGWSDVKWCVITGVHIEAFDHWWCTDLKYVNAGVQIWSVLTVGIINVFCCLLVTELRYADKRIVSIMNVYIERNNLQL